ncbi:hypothetical protein [Paenibacillus polymyxa]|uniref:hypothetical protein n=1 Tax=Paenibacillus polymyxa TaxID=1406 RepID=UPI0007E960BA|nr:hypothetical protein [Paenibacillus polymyxa]OAZ50485.1 hypothetical protein A9Z39_07555 [Paenibacillus polymyxa]
MHIEFITSDSIDKLRAACYEYNYQEYGSVQRDRRICKNFNGRTDLQDQLEKSLYELQTNDNDKKHDNGF